VPLTSAWRVRAGDAKVSKGFDNSSGQAVDLSNLDTIIRERREALGLTQSRLARLSGLSRQTLVGLEVGALSDLGFNRVAQVLAVLGLDLDPPSQAVRLPAEFRLDTDRVSISRNSGDLVIHPLQAEHGAALFDALRAVGEADPDFLAALEAEQARQQPPQECEAL
jgi:virulence-associated protein VagC